MEHFQKIAIKTIYILKYKEDQTLPCIHYHCLDVQTSSRDLGSTFSSKNSNTTEEYINYQTLIACSGHKKCKNDNKM